MNKYRIGDVVTLKKGHPCGANEWEVLRTGVDVRLRCTGCDREVWMPRIDFNKRIRKIKDEGKWVSIVHYEPREDNSQQEGESNE